MQSRETPEQKKGKKTMLDYEIKCYDVSYVKEFTDHFGHKILKRYHKILYTEEDAVAFVKENRALWKEYRIEQRRCAVIDF